MRHCLYVSTADSLSDGTVDEIIATAQHNNLRDEVTGFLLYNGRNFLQLIEGEAAALQSLLIKLAQDVRHNGMVIMLNEAIGGRSCSGWSMRHIGMGGSGDDRRDSLHAQLPADLPANVRQLVTNFSLLN